MDDKKEVSLSLFLSYFSKAVDSIQRDYRDGSLLSVTGTVSLGSC